MPDRGTGGVGRTARAGREGMNEGYGRKFGREKLHNINATRAACGTILRISNDPRQPEFFDISQQGEIGMESKGFQLGGHLVQILQLQASAGARQPVKGRTCSRATPLQMVQPEL